MRSGLGGALVRGRRCSHDGGECADQVRLVTEPSSTARSDQSVGWPLSAVHTGGVEDGLVSGHVEVAEGLSTGDLENLSGSADLVLENPTADGYELALSHEV